MKTEKSNNFLQIYYYRRAASCYPYGLKEKNKNTANKGNIVSRIFSKLLRKHKKNPGK